MKKLLLLLPFLIAPAAQAEWGGGSASTAASAYCGARAAGLSQEEASRRARSVVTRSMSGSFESNLVTMLTSSQGMVDAVNFQISQQCPEYSGGGSRGDAVPPQSEIGCYYGKEMCEMVGWPE